jgi:ribosomal protein S12 methylthiotransferase
LQELAAGKRKNQLLIAAGCMAQRFGSDVTRQVKGLDGLIGTRAWTDIVPFIQKLRANQRPGPLYHLPETGDTPIETVALNRQQIDVGRASAYLKISDGCSAPCAFCTIPSFKGLNRSRPREHLLAEAQRLAEAGVREIILIAQDTTAYGRDWGELDGLPSLLEEIVQAAPEVPWFRLMYAYPGHASDKLVEVMAAHPQIIPYLDMPLQHGHPDTLKRMRRPHNVDKLLRWPCPARFCARPLSPATLVKPKPNFKGCLISWRRSSSTGSAPSPSPRSWARPPLTSRTQSLKKRSRHVGSA